MKKIRVVRKLFYAVMYGLLMLLLFQGCGLEESEMSRNAAPLTISERLHVNNIDTIHEQDSLKAYEKRRDSAVRKFEKMMLRKKSLIGQILDMGDHTAEDWQTEQELASSQAAVDGSKRKLARLGKEKQDIMRQSQGCFLPETLVKMEDGSLKPFAELQPGQKVLTYDIGYNKLVNKQIIETYSVKANHLYTINNQLRTTGGERLLSQDGWKKIRNLKKGDFVHIGDRMVKIETIDYVRVNRTLYNMQVADTHNFYVITTDGSSYLVHNSSGGGGGGGGGK